MTDIFISYSKQDRSIAEALAADLKAARFDVWWDFNLYAGEDFHDAILAALDGSRAVIVIWSDAAAHSRWVRDEATRADQQKKLITTHVPGFDLRNLPLGFGQLQCDNVEDHHRILRALRRLGVEAATTSPKRMELRDRTLLSTAERYNESGVAYARMGDYDRAIADYSKAIEVYPEHAGAYSNRGIAYERMGDYDRAIADHSKAIGIDPRYAKAYNNRGSVYKAKLDYDRAIADYTKASESSLSDYHSNYFLEDI
jgi:tetratricopeptide (TPR) repeat protein